jgi:cysteine desulfurase / selenocysteine lyase
MKDMNVSSYFRNLVVGADTQVPLMTGKYVTAVNFDNAATTPPFLSVMQEIMNFAPWYSSIHRGKGYKSVWSSNVYEEGRNTIKQFVSADATRDIVIYTKNTTESINLLAHVLFQKDQDQVILTTDMEHLANDLPWRSKFTVDYIGVDEHGALSLEDVENKLNKYAGKVKLVTVSGASNVTGYVNPIYTIAKLAHRYGAKILVDGAQLVPHASVDMKPYDSGEHIDYLAFSAHKMYAPFGIGVLIGPKGTFEQSEPIYQGGGAVRLVSRDFIEWSGPPAKDEAGTPNIMGLVALLTAIKTIQSIGMPVIGEYERSLIQYAIEGLKQIPNITLYSHRDIKEDRVSLISFNVEGMDHGLLSEILACESGIAVRNGLFCAHCYAEKLLNLSCEEIENCRKNHDLPFPGMVRASFGLYNTRYEIDRFLESLNRIVKNKEYYKSKYKDIPLKRRVSHEAAMPR